MTFNTYCTYQEQDDSIYLCVDGVWTKYTGTTSMRKIYYRAYEAYRNNSQNFYVYEFEGRKVTGAMFPNYFYRYLSCTSINGIPAHALPQRIILKEKMCKWKRLGNGCGSVCTHCGVTRT